MAKSKKQTLIWLAIGSIGTLIIAITALYSTFLKPETGPPVKQIKANISPDTDQLFDIKTGKFGFKVDPNIKIEKLFYNLENCTNDENGHQIDLSIPEPTDIDQLTVHYDKEEMTWKILTNELARLETMKILQVPQKIGMVIGGLNDYNEIFINIFTDQQYSNKIEVSPSKGKIRTTVNIGSPGFSGYLDPDKLPENPKKNMVDKDLGPIAVVIISAIDTENNKVRSKPYLFIRSGFRTPDDKWIINNNVQFAFAKGLPPLVIFQSLYNCSPTSHQGIYASNINGSKVYRISPDKDAQNTLVKVTNTFSPATVYFRSNFETLNTRVCYESHLEGHLFSPPSTTNETNCRQN